MSQPDRYKIVVNVGDRLDYTLKVDGAWPTVPEYDPFRLVAAIADGLRRGGYEIEVTEERTETTVL